MKNLKFSKLKFSLLIGLLVALLSISAAVVGMNTLASNKDAGQNSQRITIKGAIKSIDTAGNFFVITADAPAQAGDQVIVKIDRDSKLVGTGGKTLKFADLKVDQKVAVETDPVMIMIYPAQVKGWEVTVQN